MTDLDWYDRLWLFGKDNTSIEEWRDDIMNKNVNSSFILLIKVVIIVETLHSATSHHSVHLPHLIVLQTKFNTGMELKPLTINQSISDVNIKFFVNPDIES